MLRLVDLGLRVAALALFAVFLLTSAPSTLLRTVDRISYAAIQAGESPETTSRKLLGAEVAQAYDRLRAAIPREGAYFLVDGGTLWQGSPYWVRYRLAPRKAVLASGELGRLPTREEILQRFTPDLRYAVVALPEGNPPVLVERSEFLAALEQAHAAP